MLVDTCSRSQYRTTRQNDAHTTGQRTYRHICARGALRTDRRLWAASQREMAERCVRVVKLSAEPSQSRDGRRRGVGVTDVTAEVSCTTQTCARQPTYVHRTGDVPPTLKERHTGQHTKRVQAREPLGLRHPSLQAPDHRRWRSAAPTRGALVNDRVAEILSRLIRGTRQ
jgi:hypothetical protein